ncbi:amino acid transporter [Nostoc minutum NIES-26]|uniref:Amino acid transporter n=1 Tax=Nostoc minutum NIES-26 TaxID=1844469 RepID=A0A367R7G6_9NOSO|nr:amino acid transporter [Nostoc minutum NIES-26]
MPKLITSNRVSRQFIHWLLAEDRQEKKGPYRKEQTHRKHPWWQVMCLTGVDYFSTLGYQPGIAAIAAGALSPVATLVLVLLTLFGALPIYRRVAAKSPHGEGSIAMLEHLLPWWQGKLFVLCLLGFVATDFIITITLSAADATAHIIENPLAPNFVHNQEVGITLVLIALLGAVFLRGFREAIGIAVFLVGVYLLLNSIVIGVGLYQILNHPSAIANWQTALFAQHSNPLLMLGAAILVFPKLALGLSGFETGVTVMPLVQGSSSDTPEKPKGRIRNTRKLLTTAALIMSFFLITSSFITTLLIPAAEFATGGKANGRALAYLAHLYLGNSFGTIYDLSTISILWFAGASAMAGLLNIVPRYLPRYGMAPNWTRATRPLVLVYVAIALIVTIIFRADVEAQGGAYATGVLVLMSSAALAVTLSVHRQRSRRATLVFALITLVFIFTTVVNIIERPEGIRIASFFIGAIVLTSLISRVWRSTELRVERIEIDEKARQFIAEESQGAIRIIANRFNKGDELEYFLKEKEVREDNHVPSTDPVLFLEIMVSDASDFADVIKVKGVQVGDYRILRAESAAVPNAIAALLLHIRDQTGKIPHAYFGWAEGNPIQYLLRFILFGEGDIAVVTREVLRKAEKDTERRPGIHVGG